MSGVHVRDRRRFPRPQRRKDLARVAVARRASVRAADIAAALTVWADVDPVLVWHDVPGAVTWANL